MSSREARIKEQKEAKKLSKAKLVGKGSDEGCKMMIASTREQREQMKMRGRKLGPVEAGPVIRK